MPESNAIARLRIDKDQWLSFSKSQNTQKEFWFVDSKVYAEKFKLESFADIEKQFNEFNKNKDERFIDLSFENPLPIDTLKKYGYDSKIFGVITSDKSMLMNLGFPESAFKKADLSFVLPVSVMENKTLLAISNIKETPEILEYSADSWQEAIKVQNALPEIAKITQNLKNFIESPDEEFIDSLLLEIKKFHETDYVDVLSHQFKAELADVGINNSNQKLETLLAYIHKIDIYNELDSNKLELIKKQQQNFENIEHSKTTDVVIETIEKGKNRTADRIEDYGENVFGARKHFYENRDSTLLEIEKDRNHSFEILVDKYKKSSLWNFKKETLPQLEDKSNELFFFAQSIYNMIPNKLKSSIKITDRFDLEYKKQIKQDQPERLDLRYPQILQNLTHETSTDYRNSEDVTVDDFGRNFAFRAVQFGNWVTQNERQELLNITYDGLSELKNVLKLTDSDISFNGELAIAFGARGRAGRGAAAAHYEPYSQIFNLTKVRGAGSVSHEWFHSLDHYAARVLEEQTKKLVYKSGSFNAVEKNYYLSELMADVDYESSKYIIDSNPILKSFYNLQKKLNGKMEADEIFTKEGINLIKERSEEVIENSLQRLIIKKDQLINAVREIGKDDAAQFLNKTMSEIVDSLYRLKTIELDQHYKNPLFIPDLRLHQSNTASMYRAIGAALRKDNISFGRYTLSNPITEESNRLLRAKNEVGQESIASTRELYSHLRLHRNVKGLENEIHAVAFQIIQSQILPLAISELIRHSDPQYNKMKERSLRILIDRAEAFFKINSSKNNNDLSLDAMFNKNNFASKARLLDVTANAYWSRTCEKFARCGEALVTDLFKEKGVSVGYIVQCMEDPKTNGERSGITPSGQDRVEILQSYKETMQSLREYVFKPKHSAKNTLEVNAELENSVRVRQVANLPKEKTQDFITELLDSYPKSDGQGYVSNEKSKRGYSIEEVDNKVIITSFIHVDRDNWYEIVCGFDFIENQVFMSLMTESNSKIFKIGDGTEAFSTKTVSINEFMKVGEQGEPSKFETLIGSLTIALFPESLFEAYSLKDVLHFGILFSKSYYEADQSINLTTRNVLRNHLSASNTQEHILDLETKAYLINAPFMALRW
ncbi:hypothetical protein VNO77_49212 [Canavalia gladiata]|uniref:Large polyvalent protein-associated domain-containing protein n=1 Tax=Canavalia gladiata TaxID=3824 RepID=A0AAN9JF42_CANGL